ncbi:MAG: Crp/Fnr family transcriptional regulator [Treponemataceae bacterium]|nr:Crp/Fnr family transcriptional regulator [Treponemataceae bacterium]
MPKVMQYSKGSVVYFEGDKDDRIFILQKGTIILSSIDVETGKEVAEPVREGEFFGVKSALGHFPREETVRVLTDSIAVAMTVPEFEKLFSGNKAIIMKMLQVFSSQLRNIHHKIKSILKSAEESIDDGILDVVRSFYDDENYVTTFDLCKRYLTKFPNTYNKNEIAKYMADAKRKNEIEKNRPGRKPVIEETADEDAGAGDSSTMKQFSLPAFSRFAKTYRPGEVLIAEFEPGDCFYLIKSGRVQLSKTLNGTNKNIDVLGPSEFLGEMAILENTPRSATCVAVNTVEVLEFNKANFELLITNNPAIALILLKMFCRRINEQKRRLRILVISDITARIGDVFLMLDETQPQVMPTSGAMRRFDVTIQDISHWAGLSIDETKDEINRYVEKHRIEVVDNYVVVKNINEIQRLVEQRKNIRPS